jgi:peptide/nickel transport system substrate-binding protein
MEGSPTGPLSRDFNPFSPTSAGTSVGSTTLIYEPLYQWDLAKANTTYPWLATGYSWSNGGKTITFTVRSGVKFSNGTPLRAADVAFTFNLLKRYPAINTYGLPVSSASAPSATTAVVNFTQPAYADLYFITGETYIVPESIWSKVGNPATYTDPDPVGTGPYVLSSFSPGGLIYAKNPHYWQPGLPKVAKVDFPVYTSNTSANLALENGTLDWAGNFVSNIKKNYLAKSPSYHYWDTPLTTDMIIPNLTRFPFTSLAVREAISEGVDRSVVSADGEDYQQPAATEPGALTGLTLPLQSSYLTGQTKSYDTTYSTSACKATLTKAGWKMGSNGYFVSPSGKELAFTFLEASAFTDFVTDDQIIASQLKNCGMNVTVQTDSTAAWTDALADGTYQAVSRWGNAGPTPYADYDGDLNDTLAPHGKTATGDFERFYSPTAQSYLTSYASTNNAAVQKADIVGLEKIVATQLPVIPIFYGVVWDDYNTSHFTGWPTPSNPYMTGNPEPPMDEYTLLHLKPVS